ncbi:MAG: dGTP triphosphohydrolase [Bryobacteraceae bacterium]
MLGRLRLGSRSVGGRKYPEPGHPYRTDFQRDRDRVIHSRAFRRLEGKTQVFAPNLCDHFRNRLTHTIEVSQLARTVASALDLNEEYTETLALAHDLGHPPFGHAGEAELDRQMKRAGASFEHNVHALRIVDLLEQRYARFPGLNLTFEVREGIVKHSREVHADAEPGLREFLPGQRPPLEAQLIDLADEIAYNTADIDDAFSAGLLSLEDLSETVPAFAELREQVATSFPGAAERVQFWEIQRQLINTLIGGLIEGTRRAAEETGVETADAVRLLNRRIAAFTPQAFQICAQIKALLIARVYAQGKLRQERAEAVEKMRELFEFLLEHPDRIPAVHSETFADAPLHRAVCDYIAGMTDAYLLRVHVALVATRV